MRVQRPRDYSVHDSSPETQTEHPCVAAVARKGRDRNDGIGDQGEQGLCQDKDRIW